MVGVLCETNWRYGDTISSLAQCMESWKDDEVVGQTMCNLLEGQLEDVNKASCQKEIGLLELVLGDASNRICWISYHNPPASDTIDPPLSLD